MTHEVSENEIVDVFFQDGAYEQGCLNDTFYMEAQTQYNGIRILCDDEKWLSRYSPRYKMIDDDNGVIFGPAELSDVLREFFKTYKVSEEDKKRINTFVHDYL